MGGGAVPPDDVLSLGLNRLRLSRILYYHELYQKVIGVPGVVCEFGVRWGSTMILLENLRGMLEPYNFSRKVVGFDTFEGFPSVNQKDSLCNAVGDCSVYDKYEDTLSMILTLHENLSPVSHIQKFELVKGDASITIKKWLSDNPHTVISMAIFDMDVYQPTHDVLKAILPCLVKGSVLVFDELNVKHHPGETIAVKEILGLNNIRMHHNPHQPQCAWAIFGE